MQLQSLMLMFFMVIAIPLIILFSDHNIFFILISIILIITSIRSLFAFLSAKKDAPEDTSEELDELEATVNINVKKFQLGIKVVINLTIILFFVYCSVFFSSLWVNAVITLLILFRIMNIMDTIVQRTSFLVGFYTEKTKKFSLLLYNVLVILIIVMVTCNKFFKVVI